MGLTVVFARLKETTPARQMTAPSNARLADEKNLSGNLKSRAGVADARRHIRAATIPPSATGGTFNVAQSLSHNVVFLIRATFMTKQYHDLASVRLNVSAEVLE